MKNDQAIINGGENIEITLLTGEKETVKVKLLKISQFEEYLRSIDNESAAAELLCGKEAGWGETVAPSSLMDIVEKGHDINFTNVCRWVERKAAIGEAMLPMLQKNQELLSRLPNPAQK